jgi:hypothetical protein
MKSKSFALVRYDADDGFVFDWAEPRFHVELDEDKNEVQVQEHLYVKTLFIGGNDTIDNYVEVEKVEEPVEEAESTTEG